MTPKRHRVAMRPKVRGQKAKRAGLALVFLGLGAAAYFVGRNVVASLPPRASEPLAVEGAPEPLGAELTRWVAAHPDADSAALLAAFPVLSYAQQGRASWRVTLRKALARTADGALVGEDGVVFRAPAGLFEPPAVEADVTRAGEAERKLLALFLTETPVSVSRMKFVSAEDGWEARLSDGTRVLWGGLKFTREKAEKLRQALDDARAKQTGDFLADLRYFEDGRILLRKL